MNVPPEIRDEIAQMFPPDQPAPPAAAAGSSLIPQKTPGPSPSSPPSPPSPPSLGLTPAQIDAVRVAVAAYRKRVGDLHAEHLAHAARLGAQITTYDDVLRAIGPAKSAPP
jgi:hypothetical protein